MGGFHSGRPRQHACIDGCLVIDTAWLNKQKFFARSCQFALTWKKDTMTNFIGRAEHSYYHVGAEFRAGEQPTLTLAYRTEQVSESGSKTSHDHTHTLRLVSTPCNYGGARWWFTAPCCHRRVRVIYINPQRGDLEKMTPQCRSCLDLHYASQMASYVERHKTYERHLLANYGLYWASCRYNFELKEHYLEMTPELWALRERSVYRRNIHLLKQVIRTELMIYRGRLRDWQSLKSEEDRQAYLDGLKKEESDRLSLDLVRVLRQSIELERSIYRTNMLDMDDELFEIYERLSSRKTTAADQPSGADLEQNITDLEKMLKHAERSSRERKKAA